MVPVRVVAPGGVLPTLTPTFSKLPGTYSTASVQVADGSAGAVIHYTTNGIDPTEADPVITSGSSVTITQTTTLKASAWSAGRPASNVRVATYDMQVGAPTFSPAPSTFATPPTVTITSSTAGATIYYTLDGSMPTVASPLYTAPVLVSTTSTLKAMAAKDGWSNSTAASGVYTINGGTLATPTATPTSGTFDTQVAVSLSADAGATIRYTTNGSTPTSTSTIYTQPLVIGTTTTLKAKAFRTDYAPSAVMTEAYTVRAGTPTLTRASGQYDPGVRSSRTAATSPRPRRAAREPSCRPSLRPLSLRPATAADVRSVRP